MEGSTVPVTGRMAGGWFRRWFRRGRHRELVVTAGVPRGHGPRSGGPGSGGPGSGGTDPSALSPAHRARARDRMASQVFDIVVVGGGVTGTGAALDAATRGLSVALIEARDYAAGASSKSSKLIHGGLRYLEMLDFGLVRKALRERRLLLTELAPHLVRPVPFLWPLTHRWWERPYVAAGLLLYDTMGGRRAVPRARHFTKTRALRLAPALDPGAFVGAVQFYDAQEDDARMVAFLARTAAAHGAALATNIRMDGLAAAGGRVTGVRARDLLDGTDLLIRGRHVVLATGAWANGGPDGAGPAGDGSGTAGQLRVRPSKGVHIVVPRDRIRMDTGLLTRTERSVLFVIPWGEHWLIGDTDTEWPHDPGHPATSRADIDYLLAKVNRMLRDPIGAGKFTTYRVMARDLIDAAARDLGEIAPSRTSRVPLLGAAGYPERWQARERLAAGHELSAGQLERLLGRYGGCVDDLLELIGRRPELGQPVAGSGGYLAAEIVYACTHEGAVRLDDVLARRTRIAIETRDRGMAAAGQAAALMAAELGWDSARAGREVAQYGQAVAAELAAQGEPDDQLAYLARAKVPDPAPFYPA